MRDLANLLSKIAGLVDQAIENDKFSLTAMGTTALIVMAIALGLVATVAVCAGTAGLGCIVAGVGFVLGGTGLAATLGTVVLPHYFQQKEGDFDNLFRGIEGDLTTQASNHPNDNTSLYFVNEGNHTPNSPGSNADYQSFNWIDTTLSDFLDIITPGGDGPRGT